MLRWRLLLGTLIIALIAGLAWLDHRGALPGAWLLPILGAFCVLGSREMLGLARAGGLSPLPSVVYLGNVLIVAASWMPLLLPSSEPGRLPFGDAGGGWTAVSAGDWVLIALAIMTLLAFAGEMARYRAPGETTRNLAIEVFSLVYVGLLLSFAVRLRLGWGIGALGSMLVVVKMGDTGAYTFGRLFGRHKMAPVLSPKKTWEGALGAVVFALGASWSAFRWLVPAATAESIPRGPAWGWIVYGLVLAMVGLAGDLAESLIKRDVGQKDSGHSVPGFGGVLDMLDSVLLAAPVAYVLWAFSVVGR